MSRIFISHSSHDVAAASALVQWLSDQEPQLANEIFLDVDPVGGLRPGARWKRELFRQNSRCEAVICLLSKSWVTSHECKTEFRTAESLGKQILVAPAGGHSATPTSPRSGSAATCSAARPPPRSTFGDAPPVRVQHRRADAVARRDRGRGHRTGELRLAAETRPAASAVSGVGAVRGYRRRACSSAAMRRSCGGSTSCADAARRAEVAVRRPGAVGQRQVVVSAGRAGAAAAARGSPLPGAGRHASAAQPP